TQTKAGQYTFVLGPDIRDTTGRQMDQNSNNVAGETPGDQYTGAFKLFGPFVSFRNAEPDGAAPLGTQDRIRVVFSSPMDASTVDPADMTITGPGGAVPVTGAAPDPNRPATDFFFTFAPQTKAGTYNLLVGPSISDVNGNPLDQNRNQITGEVPGDQFASNFTVDPFFLTGVLQTPGTP